MKRRALILNLAIFLLFFARGEAGQSNPAELVKNLADKSLGEQAADKLHDLGDAALGALSAGLLSEEELVREKCASVLGKLKNKRAVPLLILALESEKSRRVRLSYVKALGEIGDERAFFVLKRYAESSRKDERSEAVGALGHLRDRRAFMSILSSLMDSESAVRQKAAGALLALGDKGGAYFLERTLRLDASAEVRAVAASALSYLAGRDCIPFLVGALEDEDAQVRSISIRELKRLTKEDFGFRPSKKPGSQKKSLKKWRRFCRENEKSRVPLERPDLSEKGAAPLKTAPLARALLTRARAAREKEDYEIAAIYFEKAAGYSENPGRIFLELADVRMKLKEYEKTLVALESAIISDSSRPGPFYEISAFYMSQAAEAFGGAELAEPYCAFGRRKFPDNAKLIELLADIKKKQANDVQTPLPEVKKGPAGK